MVLIVGDTRVMEDLTEEEASHKYKWICDGSNLYK